MPSLAILALPEHSVKGLWGKGSYPKKKAERGARPKSNREVHMIDRICDGILNLYWQL